MLYLTEAQMDMVFAILEKNNRLERTLVLQFSIISSRNELSENRLFSPNRFQHSLASIEVLILAVVLAHYPGKTIDELLEEIKREYINCEFFTHKASQMISFMGLLMNLIDKEFLVSKENTCFLNETHLDLPLVPMILPEVVKRETVEMNMDGTQERITPG
ncbi:Uncharacterised protein [Legionella donaldsonii]|uniref:Uncharacterized protein n=1 Tax=Legionella donaldsonii TaxID=45060 RepID=A0A378IZM5_9GAMM|nr:hypothetical protein [Legionella donaldsonii]STX40924.1 Uncharacterised protein [Legionella donaldsonii]